MEQKSQINGILWMLAHCFFISFAVALVKILTDKNFNPIQITFFYSTISMMISLPQVIRRDGRSVHKIFKPKSIGIYLLKSGFGFVAIILYFSALKEMPMTDVRAIALFSPVCTFILALFFLKEKLNYQKVIALAISLIGGYIIINPTSVSFYKSSILVILSVICWSFVDIIIKKISFKEKEYLTKQVFLGQFFITLYSLLYSCIFGFNDWIMPSEAMTILLILAVGFGFWASSISLRLAAKNADLTTIMPFDFSGMIFTIILSYIIFGEFIKQNTHIGGAIVFLSSLYFLAKHKKSFNRKHRKALKLAS
jgi:drug/metabolite transporter (DMT)-like permease